MINMTQFETDMLDAQEIIIALLNKLIAITSASAIAEPHSSVNIYARQEAASYAQRLFESSQKNGKGSYDEPY